MQRKQESLKSLATSVMTSHNFQNPDNSIRFEREPQVTSVITQGILRVGLSWGFSRFVFPFRVDLELDSKQTLVWSVVDVNVTIYWWIKKQIKLNTIFFVCLPIAFMWRSLYCFWQTQEANRVLTPGHVLGLDLWVRSSEEDQ